MGLPSNPRIYFADFWQRLCTILLRKTQKAFVHDVAYVLDAGMHNLEFAPEKVTDMTAAINPGVYMEPRRKAILCLCYDTNMLQVRQMLLEHFGYTVLPTTSVEDAKSLAEGQCPDMLLMDHSYPDVDFEHLAQQVKNVCPEVITVVLSPFYSVHNGSKSAIDRFVAKDEGPDALISQIEELFDEGSSQQQRPAAGA